MKELIRKNIVKVGLSLIVIAGIASIGLSYKKSQEP